jgi:soluble lytic murein transglycosylase-like protein
MVKRTILVCLACGLLLPGVVSADVYKYRDARGHIHLTDKPMSGMRLLQRYSITTGRSVDPVPLGRSSALAEMNARRDRYSPFIERAAAQSRLSPELVHAVVRAESAYRSDAISSKGAVGLMQLMPGTAERYGVTDRYDPQQNVQGGSAYLRDLLDMFEGNLELALAGYNAGENAVIRHGYKIPPYKETQGYVRKVIRFYNDLSGEDRVALR